MQEITRLIRGYLAHWIEHNNEHAERYEEWAKKAKEAGLEKVSER